MKAVGRIKFTNLVGLMYITLNVVSKKVLCVDVRLCRGRIAVERKLSLHETRYD